MSLQLPSLPIVGCQDGEDYQIDLARVKAVSDEKPGEYGVATGRFFLTAKPEFHQAISAYIALHYVKVGVVTWVNPAGIRFMDYEPTHCTVTYGKEEGLVFIKNFSESQVKELIRRAGLVSNGHEAFMALEQVIVYDADGLRGHCFDCYFRVTEDARPNLLNILEASDWLAHKDGSWSNPDQVRMLKGETIVYSSTFSVHIDELTPDAQATVRALPWARVDEGTLLNLNQVQIIGPPNPDGAAIVVSLGAGVEYAISKEANTKILASLIGFMPPTG